MAMFVIFIQRNSENKHVKIIISTPQMVFINVVTTI